MVPGAEGAGHQGHFGKEDAELARSHRRWAGVRSGSRHHVNKEDSLGKRYIRDELGVTGTLEVALECCG